MGWTVSEAKPADALFDPETGEYLNEKTMKAIREVESGKGKVCDSLDDILAAI